MQIVSKQLNSIKQGNSVPFSSIVYFYITAIIRFNLHGYNIYKQSGKSTKIFYSSKSTITLLKFYLSTSKSTSLKYTQVKVKSSSFKIYSE